MKPLAIFVSSALLLQAADPIRGFPPSQWAAQRDLEHKAQAIPSPDRIRAYLERMSREPHHAGSPASRAVADYALGLFREFCFDAHIEEFEALLLNPTSRSLALVGPTK